MNDIAKSVFKRLLGIWKTTGQVSTDNSIVDFIGEDSYELILQHSYIFHKANVYIGGDHNETFEIIELKNSYDECSMHHFNSKGEKGLMTCSIKNNNFVIEGNGLRFIGTIKDDNTEIVGNWFRQSEEKEWKQFITIKLERTLATQ